MREQLYLECYTGISGDMLAGALLDLGVCESDLRQVLNSIPISGYEVVISKKKKAGVVCCDFDVRLNAEYENHDHDMQYLYGRQQEGHEHQHCHEEETRPHSCEESSHSHSHHTHRGLTEIRQIIEQTEMTPHAREVALHIFQILAEAEGQVHGVLPEKVHFHEVGAIDSIVDVIAIAVCFDQLKIDEVIVPVLYEGRGHVRCQHGWMPVPVPAVEAVARAASLPLHLTQREGELVTPTGAAAVAAIMTGRKLPDSFRVKKRGTGCGKREYEIPSLVRAMLIEPVDGTICSQKEGSENEQKHMQEETAICRLETDIDDCSGEVLGYVMERLYEAGAREVHYMPVYMKKNRPAYELVVICLNRDCAKLQQIVFEETTTIGIRVQKMERVVLDRNIQTVSTPYGTVDVKVCRLSGSEEGQQKNYPEYESVAALARKTGRPFREIFELAEAACRAN